MGAVNTTLTSEDKDEYGCEYFASFEHFPYSETSHESFYLGRYSREGKFSYKHDDLCRIRAKRHKIGRHRHWESQVRIGRVAHEVAKDFNKAVVKQKDTITISVPIRAEMASVFNEWAPVGMCLRCCKPHKKKLVVGEVVLLEPYFSSRENEYYSDSTGCCENENLSDVDKDITQAFSHYSWEQSGGKFVICGLKGRKMDKEYYFRGPTVHSNPVAGRGGDEGGDEGEVDGEGKGDEEGEEHEDFGDKDEGLLGIRNFFVNHECNQLCENFSKL
ncbi:uncharacterized protein LOC124138920 [Haliotis rufescens]|uniref:uncharacterized protein LOC124138920 n=1 Tax=Haliotis rufescens TaxID=6454 RepID=UPI00201E8230|nr:uncharacterized protein LOC124138920 [Haliotis rufescens]XP_046361780.2 uncharacterized protein LOC124138920 [Haliotis rufescens]